MQSTSPSYLLMASLDAARRELAVHGTDMMEKAVRLAGQAGEKLRNIPGVRVLDNGKQSLPAMFDKDVTRLVFSASDAGISGYRLGELLYERFRVPMSRRTSTGWFTEWKFWSGKLLRRSFPKKHRRKCIQKNSECLRCPPRL